MPLPNLVVAGAQKAGTTTLWAMLNQHPAIHMTSPKELHFFDRHFKRGVEWYSEQFQARSGVTLLGEATPIYMADQVFRERMHATIPTARILVTLREPAPRAYSHYWMMRAKKSEDLQTFELALRAEPDRWRNSRSLPGRWRFAYLRRGHYAEQLEGLAQLYGRANLHVIIMEDLLRDPRTIMRNVFDFLQVDSSVSEQITLEHRKSSRQALKDMRGYSPMSPDTQARLRDYFAPHNQALQDWMGRRVDSWER